MPFCTIKIVIKLHLHGQLDCSNTSVKATLIPGIEEMNSCVEVQRVKISGISNNEPFSY